MNFLLESLIINNFSDVRSNAPSVMLIRLNKRHIHKGYNKMSRIAVSPGNASKERDIRKVLFFKELHAKILLYEQGIVK